MKPNAFFPSLDIGTDPAKIRDWAQAAEDLGYAYIEVPDHVFGAKGRDGWVPLYNEKDSFHETFVTLGFLAAVTKTIGLSTGILIAPQRQTGVIAKQAAEVDILSGGRLRLGIGVGWNHVEYAALGVDWKTRGARQAEQVEVLRRLWSGELVSFTGRFHNLQDVSIVPPPVQRPIPIWFGGSSDAVIRRAARLGDGWMPILAPDTQAEQKLGLLRNELTSSGRDPDKFGIEAWLRMHSADPQGWATAADGWRRLGAGMVMLYPMYRMTSLDDHIETLRRFKEVIVE
jgi:probable F420-dependent oxidoreductase